MESLFVESVVAMVILLIQIHLLADKQNGLKRLAIGAVYAKVEMDVVDIGEFITPTERMRAHVRTLMDGDILVVIVQKNMD